MEIWHNPRCSKSRQTLALLEEAGVEPDVRRYLDDPPDEATLTEVLGKLGLEPWDVARLGEDEAKRMGMANWGRDAADRQRWLDALVSHPRLIERPIVVSGDRAVVGRPPENVEQLL